MKHPHGAPAEETHTKSHKQPGAPHPNPVPESQSSQSTRVKIPESVPESVVKNAEFSVNMDVSEAKKMFRSALVQVNKQHPHKHDKHHHKTKDETISPSIPSTLDPGLTSDLTLQSTNPSSSFPAPSGYSSVPITSGNSSYITVDEKHIHPSDAPIPETVKFDSHDPVRKAIKPDKGYRLSKDLKHFIHNVEVKYQIVDEGGNVGRYNNFDGVFWKNSTKSYFKDHPNWPPKKWSCITECGHFFWTKGYYKDWADKGRDQFHFWAEQQEQLRKKKLGGNDGDSEDEVTKHENLTTIRVKAARELGLREADDWESYDSVSSDGKVTKKFRRKSMKSKDPLLYNSHAARKAERQKQRDKLFEMKNKGPRRESQIHIKNPHFIQDLFSLGSTVNEMDEKEITEYLARQGDNPSDGGSRSVANSNTTDASASESTTTTTTITTIIHAPKKHHDKHHIGQHHHHHGKKPHAVGDDETKNKQPKEV